MPMPTDRPMVPKSLNDPMEIGGVKFASRMMLGTAGYPNRQVMLDAIEAGGAEIVTASIRRISLEGYAESMTDVLKGKHLLPNTSGCATAKDAVLTAQLAREALETNWVKLEVIGDRDTLYPDVEELLRAAEELVKDGFIVLPYANDDPVTCRKLADLGCAAVMPMGSFIGSGLGVANPAAMARIVADATVPIICDAGLGTASDAAIAMELGCDGVLLNTAVAKALDPVRMARAFGMAVAGGREAHLAGRIPKLDRAEPSSPQMGLIGG